MNPADTNKTPFSAARPGPGADIHMGSAVVLTNGRLDTSDAKTAHGLIRGSQRFDILGVVDHLHAGRDAGEVLDGVARQIPVFASLAESLERLDTLPDYAIIGLALVGGRLDEPWQALLLEAMAQGLSVINGMHMMLGDLPAFRQAAHTHGVDIIDIRRPKPLDQLHSWSGRIFSAKAPRIAVLGTDCAVGKRTTCRFLMEACRRDGIAAEMIYTGQTGWLQGFSHGFIFDATLNDFISGEIEHAIVSCDRESSPDLILVEGQSALRNPLGPCGTEIIVSGNVKGVILQHAPFRPCFDSLEDMGYRLPDIDEEIRLMEMYRTRVLAVTLNGSGASPAEVIACAQQLETRLGRPVVAPLEQGIQGLMPVVRQFLAGPDSIPDPIATTSLPNKGK